MALEATVICIDNSEWMRNGDFAPSRFEAQQDACVSICGAKTQQNPENSVGLVAIAGKAVDVCVPLTQDLGKLVAALHKVKISSTANIVAGIRVAQLALRHRQKIGKKQEQRIIIFVGSPVTASKQELEELGKQLKKNSIAIDVIFFAGENEKESEEKLMALTTAANNVDETGKNNSHFAPAVSGNLTDALLQLSADQPGGGVSISPDLDPDLFWAMELSKQTFEQETRSTSGTSEKPDVEMHDSTPSSGATPAQPAAPSVSSSLGLDEVDDPDLEQAIKMSLEANDPELLEAMRLSETTAKEDAIRDKEKEEKKEQKEHKEQKEEKAASKEEEKMDYDSFNISKETVEAALQNLPIDPNDPEIQKLLKSFQDDKDNKK